MKIYFDETNHIRKIGVSKRGDMTINISTEFFFSYAFFEISDKMISDLEWIESEYKSTFNVGEWELKSTHFFKKNKKLYDLNKRQILFFRKLFAILNNSKFSQLSYLSILEVYLTELFPGPNLKSFKYSIEKFITYYHLKEFLYFVDGNKKAKEIYSWILIKLKEGLDTENYALKKGIKEMLGAFETLESPNFMVSDAIYRLNYNLIFKSFFALHKEKRTKVNELIIDQENNIEKVFLDINDKNKDFKLTSADSKKYLGVRAIDWYLGFFRRFLLDISPNDKNKSGINEPTKLMEDFLNSNKRLFRNFYNALGKDYWSTFFAPFSDRFIYAIATARQISKGENFDKNYGILEVNKVMNNL